MDIIIYFYKHLNINYNVSETNDVIIWNTDNKSYKQTEKYVVPKELCLEIIKCCESSQSQDKKQ